MATLTMHRFRRFDLVHQAWREAGYMATEAEIRAYTGGQYELVGEPEIMTADALIAAEAEPDAIRGPYTWIFAIAMRERRLPLPAAVTSYGPALYLVPEDPDHFRILGRQGLDALTEEAKNLSGSTEKAKRLGAIALAKATPLKVDDQGCALLPRWLHPRQLGPWAVVSIAGPRVELWNHDTFRKHRQTVRVL